MPLRVDQASDMHKAKRRTSWRPPKLTVARILAWADAWHRRTGTWPNETSGSIPDTVREKWQNIDKALRVGYRGLPGGSSLARLLAQHRGVRNRGDLARF